jgi:hypothetical protein
MGQHLLFGLAVRLPHRDPPIYPGWRYDRSAGIWVTEGSSILMANPPKPRPSVPSPRPRPTGPVSKKADMETGEDMKGA